MAKTDPFDIHADDYDRWFYEHPLIYAAELKAVDALLPPSREQGLEVGVGSGKFASRLGVPIGVEPATAMAERAARLGIDVYPGVAEALPFSAGRFRYVLMVATICFVDDPLKAFEEAFRVIRPGGCIVVGFIDRESEIGREYESRKETSVFYRDARFHTAGEILDFLVRAGFQQPVFKQTLIPGEREDVVWEGYGTGSFVVVRAERSGA
ncbi:MAG: class I SAM-dependent methyltransferase [Spirochaetaceae bacterium]|nr:MAG: class I SAM-dependent methyltransferase [Spirochaetaceae bacterium]